jgi:hypothetical protein
MRRFTHNRAEETINDKKSNSRSRRKTRRIGAFSDGVIAVAITLLV